MGNEREPLQRNSGCLRENQGKANVQGHASAFHRYVCNIRARVRLLYVGIKGWSGDIGRVQEKAKNEAPKYATTLVLLALCAMAPKECFFQGCHSAGNWLYHFTHANIFHLLANFAYIVSFKPRWSTIPVAYLIASGVSYLPFVSLSLHTCGISAMCFAMQARHDVAWRVINWRLLLANMIFAFVPCVNWRLHLAAYLTAILIWKIIYRLKN